MLAVWAVIDVDAEIGVSLDQDLNERCGGLVPRGRSAVFLGVRTCVDQLDARLEPVLGTRSRLCPALDNQSYVYQKLQRTALPIRSHADQASGERARRTRNDDQASRRARSQN